MYGRHFESMYSGSMYGGGFGLFAVWGYVIAKRNGDQIELNPHILAHIFGESLKSIEIIIEKLCSPDEHSRSKTQEGRRLVRLGQFLYQVVNAGEYDKIASEKDRQVYLRQKQRESRRKRRCQQVSTSVNKNIPSDSDSNSDSDSDSNKEEKKKKEKEKEKKINISDDLLKEFEAARKLYPGDKRGTDTELLNLMKKHKDWRGVIPALEPAIELQIAHREEMVRKKEFVPSWKHFKTYINNRSWESKIG